MPGIYGTTGRMPPPATFLLLDAFPGASGAYSFRKLRKNYLGSAVRLRRDWDNAELDFGFSGAYFDTTGADAWIHQFDPTTIGYGVTWYDQTGLGRNFSNSNTTRQPVYTTSAGRPAFSFDGGTWLYSSTDAGVSTDVPLSAFMSATRGYVAFTGKTASIPNVLFGDNGGNMALLINDATPDVYVAQATSGASQSHDMPAWLSRHTYEWALGGGNIIGCIDGGSDTSAATAALGATTDYCYIMSSNTATGNGLAFELAVYPNTPSRAGLVANMRAYYAGIPYIPPIPSGLTHRWPMTDGYVSGSTVIDIVGGLNGTAGAVHSVTGPAAGLTARFIESSLTGQIDLPSGPIPNIASGAWCIAFWVWRSSTSNPITGGLVAACKLHDGSTGYTIAFKASGATVGGYAVGDFAALSSVGNQARDLELSAFTFPTSTWMHIAVSYDGSNPARMYLNGEDRTQACTGATITAVDGTNVLGAYGNDTFQDEWGGPMYDFCIFNRPLLTAEVRQLYASSLAGI